MPQKRYPSFNVTGGIYKLSYERADSMDLALRDYGARAIRLINAASAHTFVSRRTALLIGSSRLALPPLSSPIAGEKTAPSRPMPFAISNEELEQFRLYADTSVQPVSRAMRAVRALRLLHTVTDHTLEDVLLFQTDDQAPITIDIAHELPVK